jgi:hypothetical protein
VLGTFGAVHASQQGAPASYGHSHGYVGVGARGGLEARFRSLLVVFPQLEISPTLWAPTVKFEPSVGSWTGSAGGAAAFLF